MDNSLGIFGATCGFLSMCVNVGLFYAYFKEKARAQAETSAAKRSAEEACTKAQQAEAAIKGTAKNFEDAIAQTATKAGLAEAKAAGAEAKAEAVAESLGALNAKLAQRHRDEEKRQRRKGRAEAEREADDEADEPAKPPAGPGYTQEDLFAALQAQAALNGHATGIEAEAEAEAGATNRRPRLTPKRVR